MHLCVTELKLMTSRVQTSALSYGIPLLEGASMQLPYTFHSE